MIQSRNQLPARPHHSFDAQHHGGVLPAGLPSAGGGRLPSLDHVVAPIRQVVHVLQKLVPGHHARCRVGGHEVWAARALRVGAHLLAHVLADARELVLHLGAVLALLSWAILRSFACDTTAFWSAEACLAQAFSCSWPQSDKLSMCSRSSSQVITPGVASGGTKSGQPEHFG